MKRLAAFCLALVLFLGISTGIRSFADGRNLRDPKGDFQYWYNPYKDRCVQALTDNLGKKTMLVFGSSELGHQKKSRFYIKNMFHRSDLDVMNIGQPYSQDLNHATVLAALAPSMHTRKAVLLLSPNWFFGEDVKPDLFSIRFSDSAYVGMLQNPTLSRGLKEAISKRTRYLLRDDRAKQKRVEAYDARYLRHTRNPLKRAEAGYYRSHTRSQERAALIMAEKVDNMKTQNRPKNPRPMVPKGQAPDWEHLQQIALERTLIHSNNPLQISDRMWKKKFARIYRRSKGLHLNTPVTISREYEDFDLFLRVCEEEGIDVQVILQPVSGFWYDHTGIDAARRNEYRKKISEVAMKNGVKVTDLSKFSYTPGILTDAVHPWKKGWVILDEKIYNFYKAPALY